MKDVKRIDKRMTSNKRKFIPVFLILVLFIALGFAALSATLGINGTTVVEISYDVHFENVEDVAGDMQVEKSATINPDDDTKIDFAVLLTKPGEYYEFETDIVNTGKLDAYLGNIEILGLDEEASKYLDISYRYTDGFVNQYDLLEAGDTARLNVMVKFKYDIDAVPNEGTIYNLSLDLTYVHNNGRGIEREKGGIYFEPFNSFAYMDNKPSRYVTEENGINFGYASSSYNGRGLYIRSGTENDPYPIYYYRGEVNNNHVVFADYCWRIVRTTEKGGIKLIYDGNPEMIRSIGDPIDFTMYNILSNDFDETYEFDNNTKSWMVQTKQKNIEKVFRFNVKADGEYYLSYNMVDFMGDGYAGICIGEDYCVDFANGNLETIGLGELTKNDIIEAYYYKESNYSTDSMNDTISFSLLNTTDNLVPKCSNSGYDSVISNDGISAFKYNSFSDSLADIGYMYGEKINYTTWSNTSFIYADDVLWNGATYTLINPTSTASTLSNVPTKHYTCKQASSGTCTTAFYAYGASGINNSTIYGISLSNGRTIDDILTSSFRNENDSILKSTIDYWFEMSLTNKVDKTKKDYQNYLEDAVWCNDRTITSGGFAENGSPLSLTYFGASGNRKLNFNSVANPAVKDDIACPNKNDRFTVSDTITGNGKLKYKVGTITADETSLAGIASNGYARNVYLNIGTSYWVMTPYYNPNPYSSYLFYIWHDSMSYTYSTSTSGVRPSVVIKNNIKFSKGDGTTLNPFIID